MFNFMWKILQYEHTQCWVHLYIVGSIQMGNMPEWTLREVSWNISSRSNATSHFDSLAVVHLHVWIDYLSPFLTLMHWTLESYFLFHSHVTFTLTSSLSFKNHSSDQITCFGLRSLTGVPALDDADNNWRKSSECHQRTSISWKWSLGSGRITSNNVEMLQIMLKCFK